MNHKAKMKSRLQKSISQFLLERKRERVCVFKHIYISIILGELYQYKPLTLLIREMTCGRGNFHSSVFLQLSCLIRKRYFHLGNIYIHLDYT